MRLSILFFLLLVSQPATAQLSGNLTWGTSSWEIQISNTGSCNVLSGEMIEISSHGFRDTFVVFEPKSYAKKYSYVETNRLFNQKVLDLGQFPEQILKSSSPEIHTESGEKYQLVKCFWTVSNSQTVHGYGIDIITNPDPKFDYEKLIPDFLIDRFSSVQQKDQILINGMVFNNKENGKNLLMEPKLLFEVSGN